MYDKAGGRPHIAKQLGNTEAGYGVKFAGRGFVQLPALRLGRTKPRSTDGLEYRICTERQR